VVRKVILIQDIFCYNKLWCSQIFIFFTDYENGS